MRVKERPKRKARTTAGFPHRPGILNTQHRKPRTDTLHSQAGPHHIGELMDSLLDGYQRSGWQAVANDKRVRS